MALLDADAAEVIWGTRRWCVLEGDAIDVLDRLPSSSVDSIVTDPPAGIAFMGQEWDDDHGGAEAWIGWLTLRLRASFRVLKPGGHALVWALPRTSHWTGRALEDAGFEVRDRIAFLFGSGFPKSLDVSKEIDRRAGAVREVVRAGATSGASPDGNTYGAGLNVGFAQRPITAPATAAAALQGWGTALKPACEDWWLVRRPLSGSIAANVLQHGTGALNIDGCRVEGAIGGDPNRFAGTDGGSFAAFSQAPPVVRSEGRWPAHLVLSHSQGCQRIGTRKVKAAPPWNDNRPPSMFTGRDTSAVHHAEEDGTEAIDAWQCVAGCPVALLDEQSGDRASGGRDLAMGDPRVGIRGNTFAASRSASVEPSDGGASRYFTQFPFDDSALEYEPFFYSAKASTDERERGCEHFPGRNLTGRKAGSAGTDSPRAGAGRKGTRRNGHPTVKSVDLMRWLCRLVTPPGGLVLDLFAGSGSTGVACSAERLRFIGIELSPEYAAIARARIEGDAPLFNQGGGR